MTNKTDKEILEEFEEEMLRTFPEEYVTCMAIPALKQALSRKEEETIELFRECLPGKLRGVDDHCNGHNNCLSQIKDNLKSKGIEL